MLNEPPPRPSSWEWQRMSDAARDRYLMALYDWLDHQQMDPRWLSWLICAAEWYDDSAKHQIVDPNWKRGMR